MKTVQVTVDVDVELSDIDTDDLVEELESRGHDYSDSAKLLTEMFYAFKLGKEVRAIEIAKQIAMQHTGMIL